MTDFPKYDWNSVALGMPAIPDAVIRATLDAAPNTDTLMSTWEAMWKQDPLYDLIEQQRTGFLVPIRAPEKLAEIIGWIADHKEWVDDVRPAVLEKARQSGWDRYTRKILAAVCRL